MFASVSHGYDTLDHFRIDPRLGTDEDFDHLVRQADERGLRILLDGVFNHLAADHELVQRARAAGPETDDGRWLRWEGEHPRVFEGTFDLVELDLSHPPAADYVVEVMCHWLDRGIDGWRLDAAYSAGAEAWSKITRRVKQRHPDCWVLGEVIHGDYPAFVATSGVDSVTQYELWHGIWHSLNHKNFHELEHALGRHATFCETFRPQTFIGNHDVTRIATKLHDERHLPLAVALLLLLPGIPSIYAGDEQGFDARKMQRPYGDHAVRPPFPATPRELLPFGRDVHDLHRRLIGMRRRAPWLVDAALSVRSVTNTTIVIDLIGSDGQRMTLALNASDEPFEVASDGVAGQGTDGERVTVDPRSWAVVPS
jgi:glycosidase